MHLQSLTFGSQYMHHACNMYAIFVQHACNMHTPHMHHTSCTTHAASMVDFLQAGKSIAEDIGDMFGSLVDWSKRTHVNLDLDRDADLGLWPVRACVRSSMCVMHAMRVCSVCVRCVRACGVCAHVACARVHVCFACVSAHLCTTRVCMCAQPAARLWHMQEKIADSAKSTTVDDIVESMKNTHVRL